MPQLRIIFTGLCAGGPPGPLAGVGDRTVDGPYTVVMPSSRPRTSKRDPSYTIPVHLPFLAARRTDVTAAFDPQRRLESLQHVDDKGVPYYIWLFSRERLELEVDDVAWTGEGKITYEQTDANPHTDPIRDRTERDVNWIPDMRLIWPEAATIRKGCLPPGKDPYVALQVTLKEGKVSSRFPSRIARSERRSHFEPVKVARVEHVITRQMLFTAELPDGAQRLRVLSKRIDDGADLAPIELDIPREGLEIFLGNTDLQDLINTVSGKLTDNEYDFDADFELYYDILELPGTQARGPATEAAEATASNLPIPISDPEHGGHNDCPPLRVNVGGGS